MVKLRTLRIKGMISCVGGENKLDYKDANFVMYATLFSSTIMI